jgi:hypothetical protein
VGIGTRQLGIQNQHENVPMKAIQAAAMPVVNQS